MAPSTCGERRTPHAGPDGTVPVSAADGRSDVEALEAEIAATREQLSRTIDELGDRLDVPARARERAARTRDTAVETYRESPPAVIGAGLALVGLVVGCIVLRRRRANARRKR
jgi:ElaB/YqjD/DUF883 family membrane-anchored ribosome-binding protein